MNLLICERSLLLINPLGLPNCFSHLRLELNDFVAGLLQIIAIIQLAVISHTLDRTPVEPETASTSIPGQVDQAHALLDLVPMSLAESALLATLLLIGRIEAPKDFKIESLDLEASARISNLQHRLEPQHVAQTLHHEPRLKWVTSLSHVLWVVVQGSRLYQLFLVRTQLSENWELWNWSHHRKKVERVYLIINSQK